MERMNPASKQATPDHVVTYAEAVRTVQQEAEKIRKRLPVAEQIPLLDATGRVLAEAVRADRDQPPFPRSTRDGFACIATDVQSGRTLRIIGQVRAGEAWQGGPLQSGEAIEIMTGAPVPDGADCVVMVEHVQAEENQLRLDAGRSIASGENIVPAGAEAKSGTVLVPAGTRLAPSHIAAAAACGYALLSVFRKPRIAILATGDELVSLESTPLLHQIRNSNSYSLAAQIKLAGAEPVILPVARDSQPVIEAAIRDAQDCDLLLLSGGVSMGKYDFIEQVLHHLGAEFFFTGAKIQPGRPVVFGRLPHQYFFGLPGNPISTMVTFALFSQPLIAAVSGEASGGPRFALARLTHEVRCKSGLTRFLPARVDSSINGATTTVIPWQGSGDLASTANANGFAVFPAEDKGLEPGSLISVLMI
jgi:molybdopterin molybdotransferase